MSWTILSLTCASATTIPRLPSPYLTVIVTACLSSSIALSEKSETKIVLRAMVVSRVGVAANHKLRRLSRLGDDNETCTTVLTRLQQQAAEARVSSVDAAWAPAPALAPHGLRRRCDGRGAAVHRRVLRPRRFARLDLPAARKAARDRRLRPRRGRRQGDDAVLPPSVARAPRADGRRRGVSALRGLAAPARRSSSPRERRAPRVTEAAGRRPGTRHRVLARRPTRVRVGERGAAVDRSFPAGDPERVPVGADGRD